MPVFWLGKSHGQRSQAGYSPWGRKESDTTEPLRAHTHTHTHTSCATSWNKQWINIIKSEGIAFHVPFVIYFQAWGTKSTGFSSWLLPFTSVWSQLSGPTRHTQAGEPHHLQDLVPLWGTLAAFLRESSYSTDSFSKSLPAPNILKLHWKQSHKALH